MTDDDIARKLAATPMTDRPMEWKPAPGELREEATTESELFAGYRDGIMFAPASELVANLEAMARELATVRELVELLVDWAGARDKPPADTPDD